MSYINFYAWHISVFKRNRTNNLIKWKVATAHTIRLPRPSNVTYRNTAVTRNIIWTRQEKCPQRASTTRLGELLRSKSIHFYVAINSKSLKKMAGDGPIRRAQQRWAMKTAEPYSIPPCPAHPSYCLHHLFSLSRAASNHLLILRGLSSWNAACEGLVSEDALVSAWRGETEVRTHRSHDRLQELWEIMRAPYAVIILMNFANSGFYCTLMQSA